MKKNSKKYFSYGIIWLFLFFTALTFGQENATYNKNGERQGVVRVKVNKPTGTFLKKEPSALKKGVLSTGISSIDAVSNIYNASNITRLFPENPNPKLEAKLRKHGLDLWYEITVDVNKDAATIAKKYQELDEVTFAEAQRLKVLSKFEAIEASETKTSNADAPFNDPYLSDQWHYNNSGQTGYPEGIDINLYEAWNVTAGKNNIIVSVHDEGVDIKHEDLKENIWVNEAELNGTDGVDDDNNGYIDDVYGWDFATDTGNVAADPHGTHVAGTIAAVNNNGIGVSGIAGGTGNKDGVKIMSLKIIGASAANSFIYAANNGSVISQNSWGYKVPGSTEEAVRDAMNYYIAEAGDFPGSLMKGGIVVFAAGNSNSDAEWFPGFYPEAFTVSSVGPEGIKAGYSNYGSWVDIAAPGGDIDKYGTSNGVLSLMPNDKVGYMQGTSMACPHISGICALAIANSTVQITPEILMNKLLTGVTNIDDLNPEHLGKLGQLSDAFKAIQSDEGIAPEVITNLNILGMAQEFANISWKVPADTDDTTPLSFTIYYSSEEITTENILSNNKIEISNIANVGEEISHTIEGLYGLTTYYFAVTSTDRWGNTSPISNVVSGTTNEGPAINVDDNSLDISIDIDAPVSVLGSHNINILNEGEGVLRWEYETRHKNTMLSYASNAPSYPIGKTKLASNSKVNVVEIPGAKALADVIPSPVSFEQETIKYYYFVSNVIGDEDDSIPNSSATKFTVNNEEGFNLTDVKGYLKHDPAIGPVIVEIYRGEQLNKQNLVLSQDYSSWGTDEHTAQIKLEEQLYFKNNEAFWVVFHVPAGNKYPLGMGPKFDLSDNSDANCYMSFDYGTSWTLLSDAINSKDYVWGVSAVTNNEYLGTYLTLDPVSGEVTGNNQALTTLNANAKTLINGTYTSNIILQSNDGKKPEMRLPVTVNVNNQQPVLSAVSELNFGSVFQGKTKELAFTLTNIGFGNYKDIKVSSSNPAFEIIGSAPWEIAAQGDANIIVKYTPGANTGNDNGLLNITSSSNSVSSNIILIGVSTEPGKIKITPEVQTVSNISIGDEVTANITIENEGASVLKYFVPKFDTKGISNNWQDDYSETGYKVRSNKAAEADPLAYEFEDISTSGTSIKQYFIEERVRYKEIDMGFNFPFFKKNLNKLYIAANGFTTFSDNANPVNLPQLNGAPWTPFGYVSILGTYTELKNSTNIYYEVRSDRVIVQYNNLTDGFSGDLTAQIVFHKNGNIRFYYDTITYNENSKQYLNVLIESFDQTDYILYNNWDFKNDIYSGLALGYDYPGPNIIESISNGSGVLFPGESATLEVKMDASTLVEGITNRYVNIVSNDPMNSQKQALIKLDVVDGGVADVSISDTQFNFGTVFQGAKRSRSFILTNNGTAPSTITSFVQSTNSFIVTGETSGTITPGATLKFDVELPTDVVGDFNDIITITDSEANVYTVDLTGSVIDPPTITVDLTKLDKTLNYGEKSTVPFTIENKGLAPLEVVATGNEWLHMGDKIDINSNISNFTYNFEESNTGERYEWLDIRKTGTLLPFAEDIFDPKDFYREVQLERPIQFYGKEYSVIYIAENGAITFERPAEILSNPDGIPSETYDGLIAPFWTFGGFAPSIFEEGESGLFIYSDDEKVVISWEFVVSNLGLGDPVSGQIIFYNNGTIKFQYKKNGYLDYITTFSVMGVQKPGKSDFVLISNKTTINHGNGFAYILTPAQKLVIEPGETLNTFINFDASNIYAGTHESSLKLRTNVPNQEELIKPISLTIIGEAALESSMASINYGDIMLYETANGTKTYMRELDITNSGVASLDLTGVSIENNSSDYIIEKYSFDSWFGNWYWENTDWIAQWPTLNPGESAKFRLTYTPKEEEVLTNNLIVLSSLDPLKVPVIGKVILPPVMELETKEVHSKINNIDGTDTKVASFNNLNGSGKLVYELSLDYLRSLATPNGTSITEKIISFADRKDFALFSKRSKEVPSSKILKSNSYNRTLSHDTKVSPDSFIGLSGASQLVTATRFNAGEKGFVLSHFQTFVKADELLEGEIEYEIRAGGTNVSDAVSIGSGSVSYKIENGTEALLTLALEKSYDIYPNEDFYIIVTYPFELYFPQGVVYEIEDAPGRFMVNSSGSWLDLQETYGESGWMVRALEETYSSTSWVQMQQVPVDNILEIGETESVTLNFFAENAERGNQHAEIIIKSNDPMNALKQIPVKLHVNKAPYFANKPEIIIVNEGETITSEIEILDEENHEVLVELQNAPSWLNHTIEGKMLKITKSPDYESAGVYDLNVVFSDEYNAVSETTLTIEVMQTNRAPEALDIADLEYFNINEFDNYSFDQFFIDLDNDEMTYQVNVDDNTVINTFTSGNGFVLQTLKKGTTTLEITATDSFGASTTLAINVIISSTLSTDDENVLGLNLFPNPAKDLINITSNKEIDVIEIYNVNGQLMLKESLKSVNNEASLNISRLQAGIYFVKAISEVGTSNFKFVKN